MSLWATLGISLRSLTLNKFRSFLTVLGVIIGVASVITLTALGSGASESITNNIQSLGSNLLFISAGPGSSTTLSLADVDYIRRNVPYIKQAVPVVQGSGTVAWQSQSYSVSVQGVTPAFQAVRSAKVQQGRFLNQDEVTSAAPVIDLGPTLAQNLFSGGSALGQTVFVNGQAFQVIGLMASQGSTFGQNADNMAYIPDTTAQNLFQTDKINTIYAQVTSSATASLVLDDITRLYDERYSNQQAISVASQDQLLSTVQATEKTFTYLLGGTAAISLLVGGIGIMNIMLVSVAERTREIGIRKAIGAKRDDILAQFLLEAILLSVVGGLMGLAIGLGASRVVGKLLSMPTVPSLPSMLLAVGFSLGVGVVFGFYPALRAARLSPVEAVRYE